MIRSAILTGLLIAATASHAMAYNGNQSTKANASTVAQSVVADGEASNKNWCFTGCPGASRPPCRCSR